MKPLESNLGSSEFFTELIIGLPVGLESTRIIIESTQIPS